MSNMVYVVYVMEVVFIFPHMIGYVRVSKITVTLEQLT